MDEFERMRVLASDTLRADLVSAEVFAAGASGIEERRVDGTAVELWVYAPAGAAAAVHEAIEALRAGEPAGALRVLGRERAPDDDWSLRWREGLGVVRISPRLAVRPPFVADDGAGGAVLQIDPGQAFGTGGHASTRLALALLDALPEAHRCGARVLDVGTGSGVLALAALALGAAQAVGFDLDPVAVHEARRNAAANGLGGRCLLFAGTASALGGASFDLVLANLLRREVTPLLGGIASSLRPGGHAVFSGLLATERAAFGRALRGAGLRVVGSREETDGTGDAWLGLVTRR